ncbi:hypothetical protein OUZ56_012217 [Daphnia magna]|uniref:Uncharacterized protein n=1 Tax=Daphnia magna TaxID=35525 RepID=A0ABQ9Z2J0_9CRUS|nr:hypothetical protein OUZ56_012217 [Daphnia magna]
MLACPSGFSMMSLAPCRMSLVSSIMQFIAYGETVLNQHPNVDASVSDVTDCLLTEEICCDVLDFHPSSAD